MCCEFQRTAGVDLPQTEVTPPPPLHKHSQRGDLEARRVSCCPHHVPFFSFLVHFPLSSPPSAAIPQSHSAVHMSVSKPPPPPSTSHLAIPPSSTSSPSSSASSPSVTPHSTSLPPPSPVKISMQEHFAINVCPGPILPIPQISDFFPRFHDYPCTPPPPREKKILKEETFNGETGGGYKDGERRESNDGGREEALDSDDDDSEFSEE